MGSTIRLIAFLVLAILADRAVRFIFLLGFHNHVYTHHPGQCKQLPGIVDGSEDIVTSSNGLAFISSGILKTQPGFQDIRGRVFLFDFNHPEDPPKEVEIRWGLDQTEDWAPLGIDILESGQKDKPTLTLYIINRLAGRVGVEVFGFSYDGKVPVLQHKRTIQHKNIWRPNNLVVVGEDRLYVTNDGYLPPPVDMVEMILSLSLGSVAYFDGTEARLVAKGLKMANGINTSPDRQYLYVSSVYERSIYVYKTHAEGGLELAKVIALSTTPDNINIDKNDGSLWVGSNPMIHTLLVEFGRSNGVGQVLQIKLDKDFNPTVREIIADDTGLIRASSVASRHGNAMIIGTITNKAVYCEGLQY